MAHTPGYEYDVFLSYSQANDSEGWVTRFEQKLTARLRERLSNNVTVFRDTQSLQGNQELTPKLREAVANSAVFVPIVSRNYLTRPWCLQECQTFLAAKAGGAERIFPVRYDDVSPAAFQKLLGGDLLGYTFFGPTGTGKAISEFDTDSQAFKYALLALREDIGLQLEKLPSSLAVGSSTGAAAHSLPSDRPVVFVADPPPPLARQRDELVAFLRDGFRIEILQPGTGFHETDGFEARIDGALQRADLFVQLLGRSFVPHPDEDVQSWDRWQYLRAAAAGKPMQRWFNKFDKLGREIELEKLDAAHHEFVTLAGTWDCDFGKFKQLVCDEAQRRSLDRRQQQRLAESSGDQSKPLVVIRTDKSDREFATQLGQTLTSLHCEWTRVGDKDVASLEEFAKEFTADGLLFVYRACPGKWVLKRLQELRGFLRSELGRRWACGLWKDPLDDDDPLSCSLDGLLVIDPHNESTLQQFVAGLRHLGHAEATS